MKYCECGCGQIVKCKNSRFCRGHNSHLKTFKEAQSKRMKDNNPMKNSKIVKKMIESKKGCVAWNKGKTYKEIYGLKKAKEIIKKIIDNNKERFKKMEGENNPAKRKEVRAKISQKNKERWRNPNYKNNLVTKFKEMRQTKEYKESCKKRWKDKDYRKKQKESRKKSWANDQKRKKEQAKRFSKYFTELWKNPEWRKKRIKSVLKASHIRPTKPEAELNSLLRHLFPNEYKYVGNGEVIIGGKNPDFINCNGQKKIIEMWGDYWHKGEDPQDRINVFKPFGYFTLIVWEHELKNIETLTQKLLKFNSIHNPKG